MCKASAESSVSSWTRTKEPVYSPSLEVLLHWLSSLNTLPSTQHGEFQRVKERGIILDYLLQTHLNCVPVNTLVDVQNWRLWRRSCFPATAIPVSWPHVYPCTHHVWHQTLCCTRNKQDHPRRLVPMETRMDRLYCVIQSVNVRPAPYQASLFRMAIGPDAMKVLDTQTVLLDADGNPASVDLADTLIKMMDTFVMGQVNPTYERYLLRKRVQNPVESIETLITDLKTMVKVCEIPASFINDIIIGQIIFGIMDNALRERLLQEKDLTLSKCIEMCKATEAASSHPPPPESHEFWEPGCCCWNQPH